MILYMNMDSLKKAIEVCGTNKSLAEKMGEKNVNFISMWLQRENLPADRVIDVAQATDWQVTPHELRPDLYPHPDDGLPIEHRNNHEPDTGRRVNDRRHRNALIKQSADGY